MRGFTFNGKHNLTDYGVLMENKTILPPAKKKIKVSLPYMNGSYDFSTVATGGDMTFENRIIEVQLGIRSNSKEQLHAIYSSVLEWLVDTGQQKLIFDDMPDYYFVAEVESAPGFEELIRFGKMKVVFVCEPFKYGKNLEGNSEWDTFNFETDFLQDVDFDIVTSGAISIYNVGRVVTPVINSDAAVSAYLNGNRFDLDVGDNTFYGLKLATGANTITVIGTARLKFKFRKEVL